MFCRKLILSVICLAFTAACFAQDKQAAEALKLFDRYKPAIEKNNKAIVDNARTYTGDINGDNLPDCIISFVITPKEGGNAIIGHETVIYLNTGKGMKVAGSFPQFKFCYGIDKIQSGIIYISEYECAPPYNTLLKHRKLAYRNGKVAEVR